MDQRLSEAIAWWVDQVCRLPWVAVLGALFLSGASLVYTLTHFRINTSTEDMLAPELPFRQAYETYKRAFPQYIDTLAVVIEGPSSEQTEDAARSLAARLSAQGSRFSSVHMPGSGPFFERNALLYLDLERLAAQADRLARIQPFLGRLTSDMSLRGLLSMLTNALEAVEGGKEIDLGPILSALDESLEAHLQGRSRRLSWQGLIGDEGDDIALRRRIIQLQPRLDFTRLLPAKTAMHTIRQLAHGLGLTPEQGFRVRITGDIAMEYEEMLSVSQGATMAAAFALIMVLGVLMIGLRSARLVAATLFTLLVGLVLTAGFAILAVGALNMISVAFAVLYIGLGVDFAIHFCLRYAELGPSQAEGPAALRTTARDVGPSLVLCTLTTAAGFYAFLPTAYAGMSELGLISGTGMFISLATSLTLLPALLRIWPINNAAPPAAPGDQAMVAALSRLPYRHARGILWGAALFGVGAAALLPQLRFDYNSINLRDPNSESVSTFKELFQGPATSTWHITVLAPDRATAARDTSALRGLDAVREVIWLQDLTPNGQAERLDLIEDLALIMGPQLEAGPHTEAMVATQIEALERFNMRLRAYLSDSLDLPWRETIASLQRHVLALRDRLLAADEPTAARALQGLEGDLLGMLPRNLRHLRAALAAEPITLDSLPPGLRARWVSARTIHRIEVYPQEDIADSAALRRFVTAVQRVTPQATGAPVLNLEAGTAIVLAFQQAFSGALAVILILLVVTLRNLVDPLAVVIPLLYGALLTAAALTLAGIAFNFANIIALPLLLGIGVDNGIHMVHRLRRSGSPATNLLRTTTARAIVFSALTTLVSFGNLSFSAHPGTAGLGQILTLGIALILASTLLILPALLKAVHGEFPES
jgi:hypothetical protein